MRQRKIGRATAWLAAGIPLILGTALSLNAQFEQNAAPPKIDVSSYPPAIQRDFKVFNQKCSTCHSTASSLKLIMAPVEWKYWVTQMEYRPSSNINDKEASEILAFLNYYDAQRNSGSKPAAATPGGNSTSVARGRQFFFTHNCDLCHTIAGKGGSVGPPLDNVGNTQTQEELVKRMQGRRAGTVMPPLPKDTTDQQINDLVDYLLTLKGKQ